MAALPADDAERLALVRRALFSSVIGDVLDKMGLLHQFLPPQIRPLAPEMAVVGRAMPVIEADFFADAEQGAGPLGGRPFGLMLQALDDLKPGEVYLASGTRSAYAMWGELMATRAQALGAAGVVVDGYSRDTRGILALGFPTFSHGSYGQDQGARGKVVDFRVGVEIGGVRIAPGDLIVGDLDGVVAVPRAAEDEALARALEKVAGENRVAEAIRAGMSTVEAFETFGVM
ncbi:MAG: RraA family protein [Alphaproteobacteria bacterium]